MSPLKKPPADTSLWTVVRGSLSLVRINVYEPIAWIVGKALIVRGMWEERARSGGGDEADRAFLGMYSFYVRRQSLVIHCVNSGLLAILTYILLGKFMKVEGDAGGHHRAMSAAASASLWAVHPCHGEVIGWPSANPYSLCGLFALLCAIVHASSIRKGERSLGEKAAICILYVCSVFSKSASIALPGALIVIDVHAWFVSNRRVSLSIHGPLALIALALAYVTVSANEEGTKYTSDLIDYTGSPVLSRVFKAIITLSLYLRLAFWPMNLRSHYVVNEGELTIESAEVLLCVALWSCLAIVALSSLFKVAVQKEKPDWLTHASFVVAGYAVLFLPTMGLIQHGMIQKGGDRYAYLTYIPLSIGVASLGSTLGSGRRTILLLVCFVTLTAWSALSRVQVCTYCDDISLFHRSLLIDPYDWRMVDTYAEFLLRTGRDEEWPAYAERR